MSLVGPAVNIVLALFAAVVLRTMHVGLPLSPTVLFLYSLGVVNVILAVFNLLPIPPLDGAALIERVLPARALQTYWKIRPYGFLILFLGLFYVDFLGKIIRPFQRVLIEFVVA